MMSKRMEELGRRSKTGVHAMVSSIRACKLSRTWTPHLPIGDVVSRNSYVLIPPIARCDFDARAYYSASSSAAEMILDTKALDVFVAVVPTFIASLPHAPARENVVTTLNSESETILRTHNAIRTLHFEALRLSKSIPEDHTTYELSAGDHGEATSALEDIFHLFLGCLDDPTDSVELHEMVRARSLEFCVRTMSSDGHRQAH